MEPELACSGSALKVCSAFHARKRRRCFCMQTRMRVYKFSHTKIKDWGLSNARMIGKERLCMNGVRTNMPAEADTFVDERHA